VILAGGKGERFWPRSRRDFPKQFLRLFGNQSLIELTSRRIAPVCPRTTQRFVIDYRLGKVLGRELRLKPHNFIYEPFGRNTAPALALAATYVNRESAGSTMVVLPADHSIENEKEFLTCVRFAVDVAQQGYLVTFGIPPTRPDTNYGYIEIAGRLKMKGGREAFEVRRFREKPARAQARHFLQKGGFWWNSGMFVWRTDVFLAAVKRFMPKLHEGLCTFRPTIGTSREREALERLYAQARSDSVDYAIMEHAQNVAVVRAEFDWDDVGSWPALERHFPHDAAGNVAVGEQLVLDSRNCMSLTDEGIVALLGCENLIVVRTPDAVLVCPREKAGDIKKLLAQLASDPKRTRYL
jgi:mannose-1-phosphate guanylyltransferase